MPAVYILFKGRQKGSWLGLYPSFLCSSVPWTVCAGALLFIFRTGSVVVLFFPFLSDRRGS
jgi:hypothetical protein